MIRASALYISLFTLVSTMASAQNAGANVSGDDFVRAFIGYCGQNPGNYDRVVELAEAIKAEPLPDEMRPMMAPQDPDAVFVGYLVSTGEGAPYMLGVSRSVAEGRTLVSCTVANPNIDTGSVVRAPLQTWAG